MLIRASACITLAHFPLAKASHMPTPESKVGVGNIQEHEHRGVLSVGGQRCHNMKARSNQTLSELFLRERQRQGISKQVAEREKEQEGERERSRANPE